MAKRKNTRFVDPRYFMNEKVESLNEVISGFQPTKSEYSTISGRGYSNAPEGMKPQPKTYSINNNIIAAVDEEGRVEVYTGANPKRVLDQLNKLGYTQINFPVVGPA